MTAQERDRTMPDERPMPWSTGPSGQGAERCEWCDRTIHAPATPCSIEPPEGLLDMDLSPGFGQRCQYEMATRRPKPRGAFPTQRHVAAPRPYPAD